MTGNEFQTWLKAMKAAHGLRTEIACGRLLGVTQQTMHNYKQRGCNHTVSLACAALLHGVKPYGK